jgi:hypothetical protein
MSSSAIRALLVVCALAGCGRDTATWSGEGDVLAVEEPGPWLTIEHDDIPDVLPASTTRILARAPDVARDVAPGMRVRFDLTRDGGRLVITRVQRIGAARGPGRRAVEDATAHHGGVVAMAGELHVEAAATRDGTVHVWLSDDERHPVALAGASGQVRVDLGEQHPTLPLVERDGALVASGPPFPGDDVRVHLELLHAGKPLELYFVLPLSSDVAGVGGVPEAGCVPVAAADGARVPRCSIAFPNPVLAVAATADGRLAVVSEAEGGISAWRMPSAEVARSFAPPPPEEVTILEGAESDEGATAIAIRRDGGEAAVAIGDRIIVYRVDTGEVARQLPDTPGKVRDMAWSPDGARLLVSRFGDPDARLLDPATGETMRRIPVAQEAAAVAFRPEGSLAAIGSEIGSIVVLDPASDAPPRPLADVLQPVESIAFAEDRVVWAGADRSLRIWDAGSGASLLQAPLPEAAVRLAVSPDGAIAAVVLRSGTIELRRITDGGLVDTLRWHRAGVRAVAWAGSFLVSGDNGGGVAIWDLTGISGNH